MRDVYVPPPVTWFQRLFEAIRPSKPEPTVRLIGPPRMISDETGSRMIASHILNATPYRRISR